MKKLSVSSQDVIDKLVKDQKTKLVMHPDFFAGTFYGMINKYRDKHNLTKAN